MPKTKAEILSRLDDIIGDFKDDIRELDDLLDDMKEAGMRTVMYKKYVVDQIKAAISDEYGFLRYNNLGAMSKEIRELPDDGCPTEDEDDE